MELLQQECVRRDNKKWDERRPWMEEDANEGYLLKREGFGPPCSMRPPTNSYRGLYEEVFDRFNPKLLKWRAGAMRDFLDSFVRHDDAWEYAKEWEWARHVLNMDRYEADMAAKKAEGGEGMVAGA